jgi:hypothetical protein
VTGPGSQLKGTYPPDTNFRVGTVRNNGVIISIEVAGNLIANGFLDPSAASMTDGASVLVLRFGSRWVCLGAIVDQPV